MPYREILSIVLGTHGVVAILYAYKGGIQKIRTLEAKNQGNFIAHQIGHHAGIAIAGAITIWWGLFITGIIFEPAFSLWLGTAALLVGAWANHILVSNPPDRWWAEPLYPLVLMSICLGGFLCWSLT